MMKKIKLIAVLLLTLVLLLSAVAQAELQRGDQGEEVLHLQTLLFECGWIFEEPDGVFGRNTQLAVMDYEAYAGLPVDGVADDAMIESLTEDWIRLMQELGQWTDDDDYDYMDDGMYPAFCNHWNMQDGNSEIDYCETHMQLHFQAHELMSTGDVEDAKKACALWQTEIIRLYDLWYTLADDSEKDAILAARALYLSSIEAHRIAIDGWYSCFQMPVSAKNVEYTLELPLREHAAWLCAMLSGSMTKGGEGE